ncbi:MAG: 50S ribosomal protein L1 [Candidatus Woesearchaeota archaeon]
MKKDELIKAVSTLKAEHKKKFDQSVELIVTIKDLDMKKNDNQQDFYVNLHYDRGKKIKVCALVAADMADEAKEVFDHVIVQGEFDTYAKDKKAVKKLADQYDYFVAQATAMTQVAATFGRVLGPRGKMPNPKAGCVLPPKAALKPVYERLQKTIRVRTRASYMMQVPVGKENQSDEILIDNIQTVYDSIVQHLPQQINNIKEVFVKKSMSPIIKINT